VKRCSINNSNKIIIIIIIIILYWKSSRHPQLVTMTQLTEHHIQIRASDIKVDNRWLNLNSSASGPSFIARWSYRITQTVTRAVMKAATLSILFSAWRLVGNWAFCSRRGDLLEADSPFYSMCHVTSHTSYLEERDDNVTHSRCVNPLTGNRG